MYRQNYPDHPGMHSRVGGDGAGGGVTLSRPALRAGGGGDMGGVRGLRGPGGRASTVREAFKEAWLTALIGIFLTSVAIGLQFWNEGRAVETYRLLDEALRVTTSVESHQPIRTDLDQHLIHTTGPLTTTNMVRDGKYGVTVYAARLRRVTEMYQWIEYERRQDNADGRVDVSYSYDKEWSQNVVDSNSFDIRPGHHNPEKISIPSAYFAASEVKCGNYILSADLVDKLDNFRLYSTSLNSDELSAHGLTSHDGLLYTSQDPLNPQVGDVRIRYEYAGYSHPSPDAGDPAPDVVSVIGRLDGETVREYRALRAHKDLLLLYMGQYSAQVMYGHERASNALLTWALRFVCWLMMFLGFGCVTHITTNIVISIPVLRDLVALGVNVMNASLASSLSLSVICLGWVWHRPVLSLCIAAFALLPFVIARVRRYQRETADRGW